jgi:hypothetical protein
VRHQSLLAPQSQGCAFGNATEFCPHMPWQAKDKIRLLIQKLEGSFMPPPVTTTIDKTQNGPPKDTTLVDATGFFKTLLLSKH